MEVGRESSSSHLTELWWLEGDAAGVREVTHRTLVVDAECNCTVVVLIILLCNYLITNKYFKNSSCPKNVIKI